MKNLSQYVSVSGTLYLRSLVLRNFITAGKGLYDAVPSVFKQSLILALRHSLELEASLHIFKAVWHDTTLPGPNIWLLVLTLRLSYVD